MTTLTSRLRAAWVTLTGTGAAATVAFGLLVFASVLASLAIPRESAGLRDEALQRVVAAAPSADQVIVGQADEQFMLDDKDQVLAADIAAVGASLRARLAAGGVPLASDPPAWAGLTTGYMPATGAPRAAGYGQPQLELAYRSELASYGRVVTGRLPAGGSLTAAQGAVGQGAVVQAVVQAAVTTTTAARFGLRVGSRLNTGPVQLVITGIIRPANPAATFWAQNLAVTRPELTPAPSPQQPFWVGAALIGPGALPLIEAALGNTEMMVTWTYPTALGQLTAGQAGGVAASLASLTSSGASTSSGGLASSGGLTSGTTVIVPGIPRPVTITVSSPVPAILTPFINGESAAAPVLELLYVSLAVMGAVVVLLGARLVAQRRAAEFTLMRARGAALYQLGWLVLRASLVIAVVAGAAAVALAVGLTPGDGDVAGWWLAGVTIAVTLFGPVLISVAPQRVAAPVTGRAVRRVGRRGRAARRIVIETVLVALAVGGLVVLRHQGLSSGNSGLYTSAAPVLVAVPVAVIVLRCYPALTRELARLAGRLRGVVAFVGLARATRTPPGTVLPSFALVLVLSMVAFPAMVNATVTGSQVAASWQQVGADAIIAAPSSAVISPALQRQVAEVPGVTATAAAEVDDATLPTGFELPAVFVDPAGYAAVVDQGPGPRFPLTELSGPALPGSGLPGSGGSGQATVFPAVATAAAAQLLGASPTTLSVGNTPVNVRLAGQVSGVPGVAAGAVVLLPSSALGPVPLQPNLMLVAGSGLDAARLTAAVRRALPGASVTLRAPALAALSTAPVPQAAQTALTQGIAAAAGFGALVLLLSLLLTARTREMTLARLATMGLRRWQAQLLLAAETLPPVVAAAVGGVACAWLLAPLIGPSLNLAALSGTASAVAVTPAVLPLAIAAAGLVLAALLLLAASAVITYKRGSARALRIAD